MCQVPQTLAATLATMPATLGMASAMPGILLLHRLSLGLSVVILGALTVCNIVFQLTLGVADDEVQATNA